MGETVVRIFPLGFGRLCTPIGVHKIVDRSDTGDGDELRNNGSF
jgi:hypothetical protein